MRDPYIVGETFPVLWDYTTPQREQTPKFIRWDALNEEWAQKNHGQTLKRLAERGGLSPCEALANIERRQWTRIDLNAAREALKTYAVADSAEGATK